MIEDIFKDMIKLQKEMDRLFNKFTESIKTIPTSLKGLQYIPSSDIKETENSVLVTFDLPGINKEDIDLKVTKTSIEIRAGKKQEKRIKKKGLYKYESSSRNYYKMLSLPIEVDPSKTKATYKNGILRVEIPKIKKKKQEAKKIKVH